MKDKSARQMHSENSRVVLDRVLEDVLDIGTENMEDFKDISVESMDDLLTLNDQEISNISKKDPDSNQIVLFPFHIRSKVRIVQYWNFHLMERHGIKS